MSSYRKFDYLDSSVSFRDSTDDSKKMQLNLTGITTDTTRTFAVPDSNGTFVCEDVAQTLTNKTIDADNNTITNIDNADIKAAAAIDASKIHDGSVSNAEFGYLTGVTSVIQGQLDGKAASSHTHTASDVTDFNTAADARITAQKGVASGLATLDGSGKVPASQLDLDSVDYQGTWNATTNTPTLANGTGTKGHYYVVSVAGTTTIDGENDWQTGDWIIFNGTVWEKADHTDQVTSVAGKQGAVTLEAADIASGTFADARIGESSVTQHATALETALNHDNLTGVVANEHVDHSSVSITAGEGLSGGGTIAATRTIDLNINSLAADASPDGAADYVVTYDASATAHKKVLLDNLPFSSTLDALTDTAIATPADNEVLAWNFGTSKWINQTPAEAGLASASHTHSTADVTSGTFADARISESSVTQHSLAIEATLEHANISGSGTNTHAQIDSHITSATSHINDAILHRTINDAGSAATDLWSASKISGELSGKTNVGHTHDAANVVSGVFADARISESSVTQHAGALEGAMNIQNLTGAPTGTVVGISDAQTLTNKTLDADNNTITNIDNADIKAAAAIDAAKIHDGTVSNTEFGYLNGVTSSIQSQIDGKAATGHTHTASDITDFNTAADARITAQKGVASGLATLDGSGKVPASQLELDSVDYQGTWNASTNTPTLANGTGTKGHYYVVSVAGTTTIDGENDWQTGDWIIFNGTVWEKADHTDQVTSVAGKQGAVTLEAADIASGAFADARIGESSVTQHASALETALNHDNLTGFVANEHIDHSAVSITAGEGLSGGGTIAATRTIDLDVNSLTADVSPDGAADYVVTYDASAGGHKKVLLDNLPMGSSTLDALTDTAIATPADNEVLAWNFGTSKWINQTPAEAGLAAASHTHTASDVTSGTFADARIAATNVTQHAGALEGAMNIQNLTGAPTGTVVGISDAQTLTNKTLDADNNTITNIDNADIKAAAAIDAAKIHDGTVSNAEFGYLNGVTSGIQSQIDGKAASSHSHSTTDITSGTLSVSRGGTGASSLTQDGLLVGSGTGAVTALKSNWNASVAPTATDDSGSGYAVGSRWIDTTSNMEYVCLDATATAAVWTKTTAGMSEAGGWTDDGGTVRLTTATDKVGIGNSAPSGFFDVRKVNPGASNHVQLTVSDSTITDDYNLGLDTGDSCLIKMSCEDATYRQATVFCSDGDGTSTILGVAASSNSGTSWEPKFVVKHDTKVGIGKNNPTQALDVVGSIALTGLVDGRDVAADGSALDSHTAASSGVHGVTGDIVGTSDAQTLTNKTIDADNNTITNIDNADIKAAAAIDAAKIHDGTVSNAEFGYLNGVTSGIQSQLDGKAATGHIHTASDITDFNTAADARITAQKGVASGLATLDGSGKVPASQLELDSVDYQGTWNATTNTPAITSSTGTKGHYYVVSVAGTTTIDGENDWQTGDWIIFNGTVWEKADHTDQVTSVAGKQGAVTLAAGDIASGTFADARIGESSVTQHSSALETALNHDNLTGFVANEHVDHITVSITAGEGLSGGGTIAATRTIDLNINSLTADASPDGAADYVVIYDASAAGHKKVLLDNLPGASVTTLDSLTDTVITTPADNEVLAYNTGTSKWINQTPAEAGLAADSHTHSTADVTSGTFADARIAATNVTQHTAALETAMNIQNLSGAPTGTVVGTTDAQTLTNKTFDADLNTLSNVDNADIKAAAAIDAAKIHNGAVSNTEFGYLDGVTSSIQSQIDGKAASSHTHSTADITSGTLTVARGGTGAASLTDNKLLIGAGTDPIEATAWNVGTSGNLSVSMSHSGFALDIHNTLGTGGGHGFHIHAGEVAGDIAFKITDRDETFNIMEMEANNGYITTHKTYAQTLADNGVVYGFDNQHSGVASDFNTQFGVYRIGGVDVVSVAQTLTNKTINADNNTITNIDNADIKAGAAIDAAKIHDGTVSNTEFGYLNGVTSGIQSQLDGKAASSHTHSTADITSGTLTVARGGTGAASLTQDGILVGAGTGAVTTVLCAWNKTTAPSAATDDVTLGYSPGSRWLDTTADKEYVCLDNTDGAAVWVETTGSGGSGETNTASNVGGGADIFKQKTGVDLEFRGINAASTKISASVNVDNIDIDVVPAQIAIGDLSGAPTGTVVGTTDAQTLTNKTINADNNTITNIDNADIKAAAAIDAAKIHDGTVSNTEFGYLNGVTSAIQTQLDGKAASGHTHDWDAATGTADVIPFNTGAGDPTHAEGKIFYDAGEHTLAVYNDVSAVTHQLGQEGYIRVYNNSGAGISDGKPVYISGTEGVENRPTIALARADAKSTSQVIGITTQTIANNAFGYITYWGLVNDVDTSAFASGDPLYLDETTAGALRNSAPGSGNYEVLVGFVIKSDAVTGRILISMDKKLASLAGDAMEVVVDVVKQTAGTINAGQLVYVGGYDTGKNCPQVELSDASSSSTMPAFGIMRESCTNTVTGKLVCLGQLINQDTSAYSIGDALYASETPGSLTNTKPTGTALVQKIGNVTRSHASQGVIQIVGAGRTNDLPNLTSSKFWLGDGSGVPAETTINDLTADGTPDGAADYVMTYDASATTHKKVLLNNLPGGGGGETNTASNVGSGADIFKQKTGVDLEFRGINAASTKISATVNVDNIDIDVVPAQIAIGDLSGAPTGTVVGTTDAQTLTNKTLTSAVLTTPQINDTSADHQYIFGVSELTLDRTVTLPLLTTNDTFVFAAHAETLTNKTIDADNNTITNIDNADIKAAAAIDAAKIHDGTVSNTEFGYLNGVTSAIQTQFTGKVGTGTTLTAGVGLSGGGDLSTNRTIDLDINGLTADASPDGAADYVVTYDASATTHKKVLLNNLPGGGGGETNTASNVGTGGVGVYKQKTGVDLEFKKINSTSATSGITIVDDTGNDEIDVRLDINSLTADASPDGAADYVVTYDASATGLKKVLLNNLPGGGGSLPTTTKGDLVVHNGSTDVRLGVGTNDQVLIADSAEASGVKWGTLPGTISDLPTVVVTNTGSISGSAGYAAITWDTTNIENDATRLEHNNTTTSRIDVKEAGLVLALISMNIISVAGSTIQIKVYKNGTEVTHTYTQAIMVDADHFQLTHTVAIDCAANDYLELYWNALATITLQNETSVTWVALKGAQGPQGPQGPVGTSGADGDITWQNAWVTSTAYTTNQAVENGGSSYVCISNHTSSASDEPGVGGSWSTYWDLMASQGAQGPTGVTTPTTITIPDSVNNTTSSTYVVAGCFIFPGTSVYTPSFIKAVINDDSGVTGQYRIYDITNSLVISESTQYTDTSVTIKDSGTISNLPSGDAIFEIQFKRITGGGSNKTYIRNVTIYG